MSRRGSASVKKWLILRMQGETPPTPLPAAPLPAPPAPSITLGPPEQQIPKAKSGGARREGPASAEPPSPVPVAVKAEASRDTPRPADVVGRLLVRSRISAERDVAALLARAGGKTLSRQRGPTSTVVTAVVPQSSYGNFAAGLHGIGSWQLEVERSPLPNVLYVTVRLAE